MIIAEIGSVHDGSFGNAIKLIELAKDCGASSVKFQTHIAKEETLENAPMPSFFKGEPRYEYFQRTSFSLTQWEELKAKCDIIDIEFLSSPFSIKAIEILEKIDMMKYKIPSGEVTNIPLLEVIAETKKPILLSSGMSSWEELDNAVNTIQKTHNNITVLQCTSEYPCDYERVGLNIMMEIKDRYNLPIGLSDHTLSNYSAFAATVLGATVIEKHLSFNRKMYGSDAKHSLEPNEFKDLVDGIETIQKMLSSKIDKNLIVKDMKEMKEVFQKSIVSVVDIPKNSIITKDMIGYKKPGIGIPASDYNNVIGKKTKKDISNNSLILEKDII